MTSYLTSNPIPIYLLKVKTMLCRFLFRLIESFFQFAHLHVHCFRSITADFLCCAVELCWLAQLRTTSGCRQFYCRILFSTHGLSWICSWTTGLCWTVNEILFGAGSLRMTIFISLPESKWIPSKTNRSHDLTILQWGHCEPGWSDLNETFSEIGILRNCRL